MYTSKITSPVVQEYWKDQFQGEILCNQPEFMLFLSDNPKENIQVMTLELTSGNKMAIISSKIVELLKNVRLQDLNFEKFINALKDRQLFLYGADYLFYFPEDEKDNILNLSLPENIRPLSKSDEGYFSSFLSLSSEQDLDEAFVELEHWKVFGVFENDQLVTAASMYPWQENTKFADIGVLTLDAFRGKGYARQAVQAISKAALKESYEPQYRCQLNNTGSVALAKKLNLNLFAKWDIISQESVENL